jgi:hypothetical protein
MCVDVDNSATSGYATDSAYIDNLLSYRPAAKKSQLTCALSYKDEAGKMDSNDSSAADAN